MDSISREFCQQLRLARRAKGLTQADLARLVGCQQSAISMMEAGQTTALGRETLAKMAVELGVTWAAASEPAVPVVARQLGQAHCPDPECPSNVPFVVNGTLVFWPRPQPGSHGSHCAYCGEVMARLCPNCGAAALPGACCRVCGASYVPPPVKGDADVETWAAARRRQIAEWRALLGAVSVESS